MKPTKEEMYQTLNTILGEIIYLPKIHWERIEALRRLIDKYVESCGECKCRNDPSYGPLDYCEEEGRNIRHFRYRKPGQFPSWCPLMTEDELQFVGKVKVNHD